MKFKQFKKIWHSPKKSAKGLISKFFTQIEQYMIK